MFEKSHKRSRVGSARLPRASTGGNSNAGWRSDRSSDSGANDIFEDGHLQGLLGEQASKSPEAAVEFLKPYYVAALAMIVRANPEQES